jgi:aerobic-type carbon monoxide dehydrogenase small subunit (CoxS/CutS family)
MSKEEDRSTEKAIPKKFSGTLSRRGFLRDAGMIAGGSIVSPIAGVSPVAAATGPPPDQETAEIPGASVAAHQKIKLNVNGEDYEVYVDSEELLRDCLREKLGCLSIKDMCLGHGACGSCTVIMDGRPILSCLKLAIECDGRKIETAEGIALSNHPLIETYVVNYCMQCGYCTPGFICTSKSLLDRNPNPTEADIREALAGNLCRCATYIRHIPAVQQAARILKGDK